MFGSRKRRNDRARSQPPPESWLPILSRNVPYFSLLDEVDQRELQGEMQVFLADKKFEGCGGFEVTDEVRVTIAAQACILLLHRENDCFASLKTILVYPHPYQVQVSRQLPDGTVVEGDEGRLGESWHRGVLIVAWDAVRAGAVDVKDGHNVVLHEFAHQLDSDSGALEGSPDLATPGAYARWARVMNAEFSHFCEDVKKHHKTVMDRYGATNAAEFFAVATEAFFEKPIALKHHHPELYATLAGFYRQDPAERFYKR